MSPPSAVAANSDPRPLHFGTLAELRREVERLAAAGRAGTLRATGEWSPGQILQHLSRPIRFAIDGYPFRAPWLIRTFGPMLKKRYTSRTMPSGIRLPKSAAPMMPDASVPTEEGASQLLAALDRLDSGERMTHASPVFGPMTHEEWVQLHLRHAELHLGYLRTEAD